MVEHIEFDKMQGLGNDYVYLIFMNHLPPYDLSKLARDISDRHFGIGGDGLVVITRSALADFRMIMFNADGSEAQMCGNASRCIAKLVYEKGLIQKPEFSLETKAGIKLLKLHFEGDSISSVSVNMGKPLLEYDKIPVVPSGGVSSPFPIHSIATQAGEYKVHCIGMGNPHGVIYAEVDDETFFKDGPLLECHSIWPEKANIEFARILDPHTISMRVWERGTGETLACGTGACASAVAGILTGKTENGVTVRMKGGELEIFLNEKGEIIMTGDAQHVAHGIYFWKR